MTRLARGAKCGAAAAVEPAGRPTAPARGRAEQHRRIEQRRQRGDAEPEARRRQEMPARAVELAARPVARWRLRSACGSERRCRAIGSPLHDRFVEVHHRVRHHRARRGLGRVEPPARGRLADARAASPRPTRYRRRSRAARRDRASRAASSSSARGRRPVSSRNAERDPACRRRAAFADHALARAPRAASTILRIVQQHQRLQRRAGALAIDRAEEALGGVEGDRRRRRRRCASRPCRGCAGGGRRPCPCVGRRVARGERLPQPGRLVRIDARAADRRDEQAARRQRAVADLLGGEPIGAARAPATRSAGSRSQRRGVGDRRLPVGRRDHDAAAAAPSGPSPTATNCVASQSSSSGWVGRRPWLPKSAGVATSPRPKNSAQ